ncbi:MAG: hypothetical protein CMB52_01285 [Euryarchaeota archaeon]|nr:hypothetical protein [Euryarchaeota archaeon]
MTIIQPVVMFPDENARAYAESTAPAHTEGRSPALHVTEDMRRLATPWSVAVAKAKLLDSNRLQQGIILDPACGSATQLAALCTTLQRPGLGIELSGAVAPLAAINLEKCGQTANEDWSENSRILWGDGTSAEIIMQTYHQHIEQSPNIALLHVDPARPNDAQQHTLDEMQPRLDDLLNSWKPYLGKNPALILDVSPRLLDNQRTEIVDIVSSIWNNVEMTWQWLTQGRGRIDRLSLWVGGAAGSHQCRLVRLTKTGEVHTIEGSFQQSIAQPSNVQVGEHLVVADPSLIASGLGESWREMCASSDTRWDTVTGRRPTLISSEKIHHGDVYEKTHSMIQTSGEVVALIAKISDKSIPEIADIASRKGISSLKLRCSLDPEIQPKLQSQMDRELRQYSDYESSHSGFIAETNNGYAICKEYN